MRRSEREITERPLIDAIISSAEVCRLGLVDDGEPYVVPMSFGYRAGTLYFHSAREGRKARLLMQSPRVCVEFDKVNGVVTGEAACDWGVRFESVIVFGRVRLIEDVSEKRAALDTIMTQYSGVQSGFAYAEPALNATLVFAVTPAEVTGKAR